WNTIFAGNGIHAPAPGYSSDVFTQLVQANDETTWATSYDNVDGVPHPHVYIGGGVGVDGKTPTFTQTDIGLPSYGKPFSLEASSASVNEAYLLVDQLPDPSTDVNQATRHLYTTTVQTSPPTGAVTGEQWTEVTLPAGFGRVEGMVREYSHKLWIWSGDKYAWATGVTGGSPAWTVRSAPGRISAMDVDQYGDVSVVASNGQAEVLYQADTHGNLAERFGVPETPYAIAHGTYQDVYAVSGAKGTWGYDHIRHQWVNISPRGGPTFHSLTTAQATGSRVVLGLTSSALWRWDTYNPEAFLPPPPGPPTVGNPDNVKLPKSKLTHPVLTPIKRVVNVAPGQVNNVPVSYLVNPDPTPLDVYFLVDTTGSMQPAIKGLQKSVLNIAQNLRNDLGQSACFGVGGVKDVQVDTTSTATPTDTYVFKTFLPVAPCDTAPGLPMVSHAVKQLVEGGGGDPPEAQTLALKLAVTGGTSAFPPVEPAQPANFRNGAFKVIVYISDAGSHEGGGYPTIPEVIQTLNVNDVKVVSIAVQDGAGDFNAARAMMRQLALGTGSLAPKSGVDCNGDGGGYYGDLGPNDPLVCEEHLTQDAEAGPIVRIGPAILGLLLAVKDPGTIQVKVDDPNHALRGPIRGQTGGVFDMKYENGLHFTLPVGCTTTQAGTTLPVYLTPYVRSQQRGPAGEIDVQCKLVPKLPPIPPQFVQAAPLLFVPAIRPPVAVAAPVPPNPPAQPPSNVNPNAGMAREEQQQPQLAMAAQDSTEAGDSTEVVEMSAMRNPPSNSTAMFLAGAGVLMAAAAGCQLQLRRRTAYARQGR
ncbi:MAG: VWA domain-containing protein, partial [Frankiaceae bacterium]|nr:VWA domain-containing protein [Frankiaceae bacterium]MBV9369927.1 VWA domain-containing protein [Frankiales bacterium]